VPPTVDPEPGECKISLRQLDLSCRSDECLRWEVEVENKGSSAETVSWRAELHMLSGSGGWQVIATSSGSQDIGIGTSKLRDEFCEDMEDARRVRVVLSASIVGTSCDLRKSSPAVEPCGDDD
jgi:hypothetical protein